MKEVMVELGLNTWKNMQTTLEGVQKSLLEVEKSMEETSKSSQEATELASATAQENEKLRKKVENLEQELRDERKERLKLDCDHRFKNIKLYGLSELEETPVKKIETREDLQERLESFFQHEMGIENIELEDFYRIGRKIKGDTRTRPVMLSFKSKPDRNKVWARKKHLKGTSFILKEDLPIQIEKNAQTLAPVMKEARSQKLTSYLVKDTLYVNHDRYTVETIGKLPTKLQPESIATKEKNNIIFFWGRHSPLSNFYTGGPIVCGKDRYNCMEQYYCAEKAFFFGDDNARLKIMSLTNPTEQKRVRISGYKDAEWRKASHHIMKTGLTMKFNQNKALKDFLVDTGSKILCEASPHDKYWGIGMASNNPNILKKEKWGENWLGKLLMEVRNEIK